MTILQLNPVGMVSTDVGYISSITVRYNGANNVLTPDGNNQITLPNATTGAIQAADRITGAAAGVNPGPGGTGIRAVSTAA
jgi:hypothetical protein